MLDIATAKKLAERFKRIYGKRIKLKESLEGISPPNVFISSKYPYTTLGVLISDNPVIDDPTQWVYRNLSPLDILKMRLSMINLCKDVCVYLPRKNDKFYEEILFGNLSTRNVEYEAKIKRIRTINIKNKLPLSIFKAKIENLSLVSNPKIPKLVYELIEAPDIKAEEAIVNLYRKGYNEYYLQRLFSLGVFGMKINRKLVPSRWAITAVHSILSKHYEKELNEKRSVSKYYLLFGGIYGNYFYVLLFPGKLDFEYYEVFLPGCAYNKTAKPIYGRDTDSGGYYATKLSIYEILNDIGKKASALVIRIVNKEYRLPLGVWVVREASKRAKERILSFDSPQELVKYAHCHMARKFGFNLYTILKISKLWKLQSNKKLAAYFKENLKYLSPK